MPSILDTFLKPVAQAPPVKVPVQFSDYMAGLEAEVDKERNSLREKVEYVEKARTLGVKVDAVKAVVNMEKRRDVQLADQRLQMVRRALAAGCEPTQPPKTWFCGHVSEPRKEKVNGRLQYPRETWPHRRVERIYSSARNDYQFTFAQSETDCLIYNGPIPIEVLQRYAEVKGLFHDTRIYSPEPAHFNALANPIVTDPVLIGWLKVLDNDYFFEIARWNVSEDLARLWT